MAHHAMVATKLLVQVVVIPPQLGIKTLEMEEQVLFAQLPHTKLVGLKLVASWMETIAIPSTLDPQIAGNAAVVTHSPGINLVRYLLTIIVLVIQMVSFVQLVRLAINVAMDGTTGFQKLQMRAEKNHAGVREAFVSWGLPVTIVAMDIITASQIFTAVNL